jgi:tetratricopeptide (TPR) repeat protein
MLRAIFVSDAPRGWRVALSVLVLGIHYVVLFHLPKGPALASEDLQKLLQQAGDLQASGRYAEALEPLLLLHRAHPRNHIYLRQLAEIHGRLGRRQPEAEYWEQFFAVAPTPIEACPQMGRAYEQLKRQADAIRAFERCLALDPHNVDSIFFLAHALEVDGQYDRAAELYTRGLGLAPEYADLECGLARVHLHRGELAKAQALAGKVLGREESNVEALLVMGLSHQRQGHAAEARRYLEEGARLAPRNGDFRAALASLQP